MSDHRSLAAEVLRSWALDERLKARALASPAVSTIARRIAARYIAGDRVDDALAAARSIVDRGHRVSIEYTGESVRDAELADRETDVFVALIGRLRDAGLPASISFDLSHIGLLQGADHVHRNGMRLAEAIAPLGTELMVSAEASDRTDLVLAASERLAAAGAPIGLTLQARLHRTPGDLDRALALPGPIRLVKGAFLESAESALPRDSADLSGRYLELAAALIGSGHRVNVATHDPGLVDAVVRDHPGPSRSGQVEFEMLRGLGTELLDRLHVEGHPTREYALFGTEWWLYVLNRIAEQPDRVFDAILDAGAVPDPA